MYSHTLMKNPAWAIVRPANYAMSEVRKWKYAGS